VGESFQKGLRRDADSYECESRRESCCLRPLPKNRHRPAQVAEISRREHARVVGDGDDGVDDGDHCEPGVAGLDGRGEQHKLDEEPGQRRDAYK